MNYQSKITGVGYYHPPKVMTNFDMEKLYDTSDEWIRQRTGIEQRYWVEDEVGNSDLALKAAQKAIAHAGIDEYSEALRFFEEPPLVRIMTFQVPDASSRRNLAFQA